MIAADAYKQDAVRWQRKTESNQSQAKYSFRFYRESEPAYRSCFNSIAFEKGKHFRGPIWILSSSRPTTTAGGPGRIKMYASDKDSSRRKRSESGLHRGILTAVPSSTRDRNISRVHLQRLNVCMCACTRARVCVLGACARMHACALRGKCLCRSQRHTELPVLGQRSACCSQWKQWAQLHVSGCFRIIWGVGGWEEGRTQRLNAFGTIEVGYDCLKKKNVHFNLIVKIYWHQRLWGRE